MLRSSRNSLIVFFVVTFIGSWAVWGSIIAHEHGLISWQLPEPIAFFVVSVTAVVVTAIFVGVKALRDFAGRMFRWRVHVKWYLAALVIPVLPTVAAVGLYLAFGGTHEIGTMVPLAGAFGLLATQILLHLLTEEAGWRGFALPRLRSRFGPLTASVVLGLVWAAWHIPLFFLATTKQTYPFVGFVIQVVSMTIIMTWLFDRTRGSVIIAALFHAAMNTGFAVFNALWGDLTLFWLCVVFCALAASVVVVVQQREIARRGSAHALDALVGEAAS